ncbi:MAG: methyltransferase domain-containing protein [Desulfobacterales bacterium]|nr:methyltransferase domain-containing protein [Desulfobacterales bacterium]
MKPSGHPEIKAQPDECMDYFMEGRLKLIQSRNGYRFSIDAVLLSEFATIRPGDVVVDLGTGCGVILLILLLTKPPSHVFGMEIQKELVSQAKRNAIINGFRERMDIIQGDIKYPPLAKASADVIICNPPYRKVRSGRINPDIRRAIARHEILASVDDILRTSSNLLRKKGRLALIYPAERLMDIMARMRRFNLEPKRLQINYPGLESDGELVLIEASLGGRPGLEICPPLIGQGNYAI